jgi:hypothetical protein
MDERLRALPFRDGVIEYLVYCEACAASLLEGKLVPVEKLVQLEGGVLQRIWVGLSWVLCHSAPRLAAAPETLLAGASPATASSSTIHWPPSSQRGYFQTARFRDYRSGRP